MNFVRVWEAVFMRMKVLSSADERGILVWQDFIFGCVAYPSDDNFLANVRGGHI